MPSAVTPARWHRAGAHMDQKERLRKTAMHAKKRPRSACRIAAIWGRRARAAAGMRRCRTADAAMHGCAIGFKGRGKQAILRVVSRYL